VSTRRSSLALALALLSSGCGFPQLQTARTVPPGATRVTIGKTVITSDLRNGRAPPSIEPRIEEAANPIVGPLEIEVRRGVSDQVDIGARLLFGVGLLADVKLNLLPREWPAALAIAGGVGGAIGPASSSPSAAYIVHVPLSLLASVDLASWFTPYVSVGYRGFWMWGADDPTLPGTSYTSPEGRGEGLLMFNFGLELRRTSGRGVLVEYGYMSPLWSDPGHGYHFISSHIISIGFRTGAGPFFER
jgi:hypothetical protein